MATPNSPAVKAFIGPSGIRSGWRVLFFFLLTGMVAVALQLLSRLTPWGRWEFPPTITAAVMLATWILSRLEGKPFSNYGLGAIHRIRNLANGLAAGILGLTLLMAMLSATGAFRPGQAELHGVEIAKWALYWAGFFVFVALGEELMMRGYPLFALSQGIGFWAAALVLGVLFGAGHIGNHGEEILGIVNAVLAGMVFAYSVRWTGTLWWAIGCHLSWNWGETFLFGVNNSGNHAPHHWLSGVPNGPEWLSGGTVGPEGSVLAPVVLVLMGVVMRMTTRRNEAAGLQRVSAIPETPESGCMPE